MPNMTLTSLAAATVLRTGKIIKNVFEKGENMVYYTLYLN